MTRARTALAYCASAINLLDIARKGAKGELVFCMPQADWFRIALPQNRVIAPPLTAE